MWLRKRTLLSTIFNNINPEQEPIVCFCQSLCYHPRTIQFIRKPRLRLERKMHVLRFGDIQCQAPSEYFIETRLIQ